MHTIIDLAHSAVFPFQLLIALIGSFHVIVIFTRVRTKMLRGAAADRFVEEARELLAARKFDELAQRCDSPPLWSKAVPQLLSVALANPSLTGTALRRRLAELFERDVLADFDHRLSWINTVVKAAPMFGLLGTVLGMISAFGKVTSADKGGSDPANLASDISFTLSATAVGLIIAIPLILLQSPLNGRITKLQNSVMDLLGTLLPEYDRARAGRGK
jgi:biopolymer transport protein ExbB